MRDGRLTIDGVSCVLYKDSTQSSDASAAKIPDVLFYDNAQHLVVMRDMLQDYLLGEHILLVGNQVRSTLLVTVECVVGYKLL